eukprot:CAMPEP_0183793528 /NCGR_PEP_ID=MMETSP0803_2-20130417/3272_1 /TAXON_ID=195967 /ORGANISM="Crustomastix stigmata, Strain CCMP3273" /LENGTH=101 /DNA_ID=CAMNT_0026037907 /DNA_START=275 /DNA_END=577 /DNA_ORIENTATION=+
MILSGANSPLGITVLPPAAAAAGVEGAEPLNCLSRAAFSASGGMIGASAAAGSAMATTERRHAARLWPRAAAGRAGTRLTRAIVAMVARCWASGGMIGASA